MALLASATRRENNVPVFKSRWKCVLLREIIVSISTHPFDSIDRPSLRGVSFRTVFAVLMIVGVASTSSAEVTLVESGTKSDWKYLDNGSEPPAEWTRVDFDDSEWKQGHAPLGYGEPHLSTTVDFGNAAAKHITTYFRKRFDVADTGRLRTLLCLLCVDDGAVLYLNGKELIRQNVAPGPIASHTAAQRRTDGSDEGIYRRFLIPASELIAGANELAVEVHQIDGNSSDLYFDLLLKGYGEGEQPRSVTVPLSARKVTLAYLKDHFVDVGTKIPDGYADGGRRMEMDAEGKVRTDREVLVVDRSRDPELQKHLEYARSESLTRLPPLVRARFLALYVDVVCSPAAGRQVASSPLSLLEGEFLNAELLLGRSVGSGVCRHRALLFKILADEAGLSVALVRGHLEGAGPHAWNELVLDDGRTLIVDCMNPRGGFDFPSTTEPDAARYLTVGAKPFYPR